MFSIIIPTYNNLDYLKLCIHSIKKNSIYDHEIIVHVNEGIDGTLNYLNEVSIKYTYSKKNDGVCVAFNKASNLATKEYLVLGHDDMYFCPNWDLEFKKELDKIDHEIFSYREQWFNILTDLLDLDCGSNPQNFKENKIFEVLPNIEFEDFQEHTGNHH